MRNLVLNALQATPPGGRVSSRVEAATIACSVRVYDTGCGIPADRIQAVFEDFVTTKRRGLGLGLAISREDRRTARRPITVASEVGKGTTFVLDFPRTEPRPVAVVAG